MKNLTLALILLFGLNLTAQNKSKQEVLDLMAEETCKCISKKKLKVSDSMEEKEMALGLCLFTSFNKYKSKSKYYSNKSLEDIEEIGEDVGTVMVTMCADDFLSIFSADELVDFVEERETDTIGFKNSDSNNLTIEVELVAMNNDAISYIETIDDFEKRHIFLITEEFEGYDLLKKSNFKKSFMVSYKEVELFDLSEKQYIIKKVITKLEAIQ